MPERNDRDQQRFENLEPRRTDGYRATGGAWAWWWVWFIILICAFVWFAGWGWGSHGGWWWGNRRIAGRYAGAVNGQPYEGRAGAPVAPANGGGAGASANGPANSGTAGQTAANSTAVLVASNKREFEGQPLQVSGAPVTKKVNNDVFWVGSNSSAPLLVVINAPANAPKAGNVTAGESVNVRGTVEKAPTAAQAEKDWGLDNAGAQRLVQEGAYLSASQASKTQP